MTAGVQTRVVIASVDGLTGFPEPIGSVFPKTEVQLCIVHMVGNSLRYVPWKNRKAVARDLRKVQTAPTAEAAGQALGAFETAWGDQYPMAAQTWRNRWDNATHCIVASQAQHRRCPLS